jgi:hypothetical protein
MSTPIQPGQSVHVHVDRPDGTAYDETFTAPAAPTPPPPPLPPPVWAFLSYPKSGQQTINGQTGVELAHASFVGIRAVALALVNCKNIYLHDLDFADNIGDIYLLNCSGTLRIEDIRARNTGDNTIGSGHSNIIQLNASSFTNAPTDGIRRIKSLGGPTEDMVSFFGSGGVDAAHRLVLELSAFESPLPPDPLAYTSGSGSGTMVESGHHIIVQRNSYLNVGQGGIGFNGGDDVHYLDNVVYLAQRDKSNVGIYGLKAPDTAGGWEVSRNRVWARHNNPAYDNPAWKPSSITGVVGWDGTNTNVWQDPTIDPSTMHVVL